MKIFFADETYVLLKNHLYNYLLRRRAVRKYLQSKIGELILEVGSGLSPMMEASERIVYSELSFAALQTLKRRQGCGYYIVVDAAHLPFKAGSFSQVICSEVLEHLPEDRPALREIASVMKPRGSLILTFPDRRSYFSSDDRFVNHFRRYELVEMKTNLDCSNVSGKKSGKKMGLRRMGRSDVIKIRSALLSLVELSLLCTGLVGCSSRTKMLLNGPSHSRGQTEVIGNDLQETSNHARSTIDL